MCAFWGVFVLSGQMGDLRSQLPSPLYTYRINGKQKLEKQNKEKKKKDFHIVFCPPSQ